MKRMMMVAVVLGLFGANALADPGGYIPTGQGGGGPAMGPIGGPGTLLGAGDATGRAPDRYGWSPSIKRLFHRPPKDCNNGPAMNNGHNPLQNPANWAAGGYGQNGPAYNPQGFPPGSYGPNGPAMQGTLVFPNSTFTRSPRDYFMLDLNK